MAIPSAAGTGAGGPGAGGAGGNGGDRDGNGGDGQHHKSWSGVQRTRAWAGALVVLVGAAAITGVTLWGLVKANSSTNPSAIVAILSSAFTAIATMITAYFGIRAVTNTAQSAVGDTSSGSAPDGKAS